ncbi:MAG: hypothetical protein C5B50_14390 [Verrucomicrobia bacterium]|nr:MAG: hypothetical protein C5B50_14390 [Verrucomicrobiota bacterium]
MDEKAAERLENKTISKYRMIRRLGNGGMGEVWLAQDTELERTAALKLMSPELARDETQRKRFRTEARAASGLTHPHICVIYEVGQTDEGRPFIAMEYIEGQTLDVIEQQRHLRIREVIQLGIDVAEALEAAHGRGIVHRDMKPSNIMLDKRGEAKVLDFGLAKAIAQQGLDASSTSGAQTRTGFLIGTPHYMSPEQVLGRELDHRTDIFSLGIVLYELLAGQRPFLGRTVGEVINEIVNRKPEPLGLENPLFSPALDGIVLKCLEKEPQDRYLSGKTLAADLRNLQVEAEHAARAGSAGLPAIALAKEGVSPAIPSNGPLAAQASSPGNLAAAPSPIAPEPAAAPRNLWPALAGVATFLLVALIAFLAWHHHTFSRSGAPNVADAPALQNKSVAVLPFDNFSGGQDSDYLSDGLTEEITSALSRVPGLKVAARTSAFSFKGKKEDVRRVGQMLHVATLLEGSVRKEGNQIRVTAQLISAADGLHLWSETYDRSIDDMFAVEEDIARRIAERFEGQTAGAQVKVQPVSTQAHNLYLQARLYWNKRTQAGLKKAIDLFQQAIEQQPDYAAAHAGLAASYLLFPEYSGTVRSSDYKRLARAAANRALELDTKCAEAYAVLGSLLMHSPDYKAAGEQLRRALQIDPNYATGHHWYGLYLDIFGEPEEGLREFQKALDLDPLSPIIHTTIPDWYYTRRDFDRALQEARSVTETFPEFPPARHVLIAVLMQKHRYKEALDEVEKVRSLVPDQPFSFLEAKGFCLARLGREAEARQILDQLEAQRKEGKPFEAAIGWLYLGLGDKDKAVAMIEEAQREECLTPQMFANDPNYDELRDVPKFQALLARAASTNAPAM